MSIKLTEELLQLQAHVGQNTGQVIAQGTLVLPSHKPTLAQVVKVIGEPKVEAIQVEEDRVVAEGLLKVTLLYMSTPEEDGLSQYDAVTWERTLPFSYLFDIPGAMPGMTAEVEFELGDSSLEVSSDGRSAQAEWVVDGFAKVSASQSAWVVTSALSTTSRTLDVDAETMKIEEVLGSDVGQFEVGGTIALSSSGPAIEQVLYVSAEPQIASARCQADSVSVSGFVSCQILYRPEGMQTIAALQWSDAIDFEQLIELDGAVSGANAIVDLELIEFSARPVVGGTGLEVHGTVRAKAKAVQVRSLSLVESITGDKSGPEIACRREEVRLEQRIGQSSKHLNSKFTVEVPEAKPPVDRIVTFQGSAKAQDVKIQANRVVVSGLIDVEMLYEGHVDLDDPPVYAARWGNATTFEAVLDIPGAESGMDVQVEAEVVEIAPDLINRETCEVDVGLRVDVKVSETVDREIVAEAVEVKTATGRPPTYVCVRVQPDDTLWKIAARYGSSVEMLANYNPDIADLEDRDLLPLGLRLFIPRQSKPSLQEAQ